MQMISVVLSVLAAYLAIKIFSTPIRLIWKLCINTLGGALLLLLVNSLYSVTGLSIDITVVSACIVGLFGLPGFALVVLLQLFF